MLTDNVKIEKLTENCCKLTIGDEVVGTVDVFVAIGYNAASICVLDKRGLIVSESLSYYETLLR